MIYYGVIKTIYFSEHRIRDVLLESDYAFHQDPRSGHWKFLKYRFSPEGLKYEFFTASDLLDYLYTDLMHTSIPFKRHELNKMMPVPPRKDPFDSSNVEVIKDFKWMRDTYTKRPDTRWCD
ncbi:hypothetical protein CPT_Melville_125 [Salmonella phage Melville]|uniref:Uncharacterized protein n=1 Tax=Salmonella phage Melville TaxID=2041413 RepID=A0A2D1GM25_9CAUD|nr:hypothetical protein FDI73_gp125 [Salmonella phage Melville]ATN93099.1 hypothetical protein CPT_Melville_125 [Salmonella phage Melville]